MSSLFTVIGISAIPLLVLVLLAFFIAISKRRNDLADVMYGLGFILVAWTSALIGGNLYNSPSVLLVTLLVTIWGLRLASHIGRRWLGSKQEDRRYDEMRARWGDHQIWHSFFNVFLPQGVIILIVSLPVLAVNTYATDSTTWLVWLGALIWLFGFTFESIGDRQLKRFLADPSNRGKIMMSGLWSRTRHPNYFGEVTQWWAIALIALTVPYGWIGIAGAAMITFLITKVSGVPLAEAGFVGRPGWEEYKQQTPALIPRLTSPSQHPPK